MSIFILLTIYSDIVMNFGHELSPRRGRYAVSMMSFSQRMGLSPVRTVIQKDSLDTETRTALWNLVHATLDVLRTYKDDLYADEELAASIWVNIFSKPRDEQSSTRQVWVLVKERILTGEWFVVLDMVESFVRQLNRVRSGELSGAAEAAIDEFNHRFERFLVGYRFIEQRIVPVDGDVEVAAIASATELSREFSGARRHLERAGELLADRKNPDYSNSVKESISAVESIVKIITSKSTLGSGLKQLKAKGVEIHPALESSWAKMYGWTSDAEGVRHAAIERSEVDQPLAKYMLVACSAFVAYLIETGRKTVAI
ncbi:AbiJ-NTD4 domain-containing protein [Brevibacterium spongiae]|uniref:HEPN AbiJ-N-terminal domain-containing protein n=1 Tax=Brevibacterium spongiae TaxID=2909672 RepID=A0ABY5SRA5_9MICO|nr:hypothetical protein [Brevibacterium spongiae]UVI36680.1 hypothetical protein L1F31_03165 [Brevibacterium spongiae]